MRPRALLVLLAALCFEGLPLAERKAPAAQGVLSTPSRSASGERAQHPVLTPPRQSDGSGFIIPSRFRLRQGEFLRLQVDQGGLDIKVVVLNPLGEPVLKVDSFNGTRSAEDVPILAEFPGEYRLREDGASSQPSSRHVARVVVRRPAKLDDRRRWRASLAYWQGCESNNWRDASGLFGEAAKLWSRVGDKEKEAEANLKLGVIWEGQGETHRARQSFEKAASLLATLSNPWLQVFAHHELGRLAEHDDDVASARRNYESALRLASQPGLAPLRVDLLIDFGLLLLEEDENERALGLFEESLNRARLLGKSQDLIRALNSLGKAHLRLGDAEAALRIQEKALNEFGKMGADDPRVEGLILLHLGDALRGVGDHRRASRYYRWAIELFAEIEDRLDEANAANNLGLLYLEQGRYRLAGLALDRAIKLFEDSGELRFEAQARANRGWINTVLRQPEAALVQLERAENILKRSQPPLLGALLHLVRSRALHLRGHLDRALAEAETAMAQIERLRSRIERRNFRRDFAPGIQPFYEVPIDLLMERHRAEPERGWAWQALAISERARGRSLLDLLVGQPAVPAVDARLLQTDLLDRDSALLEFFLGARKSYLWIVSTTGMRVYDLPSRAEIVRQIRPVVAEMARSDRRESLKGVQASAMELSRLLFSSMDDLPIQGRLVFVVPPEMQSIPFAALPNPFARPAEDADPPWPATLGEARQIVEEPSMAVLAASRARREEALSPIDRVAVFGAARYSADGASVQAVSLSCGEGLDRTQVGTVRQLRFAPNEAKAIEEAAGLGRARLFLDTRASVAKALSADIERDRFLHFTVHSYVDRAEPDRSALLLSAVDVDGRAVDPCLTAERIAKLHLSADLVVISACSSGLGREIRGEGLVGLSQAFLAAGAKRVLVTLWDVQDQPTSHFMSVFYRNLLGRHLESTEALRQTQAEVARTYRAFGPSYWGGFLQLGDWK